MGYFNKTLILLSEVQKPRKFLVDFHKILDSINLLPEIDEHEIIVFNDCRNGAEKEPIDLKSDMQLTQVIDLICSWKGLGLICYRHENFKFPIGINYITWDDQYVQGLTISVYGNDLITEQNQLDLNNLINNIINLIDYSFAVGDIGNLSKTYINLDQKIEEIIKYIELNNFEIDKRKRTIGSNKKQSTK